MDIKGHLVERVWIEAGSKIAKEYYLSVTFDRGAKKPLVMLSAEGGVNIEEVAANRPEALARLHIDPLVGLQPHDARWLCFHAGIDTEAISGTVAIIQKLYGAFVGLDAMLTEINPLILTEDGRSSRWTRRSPPTATPRTATTRWRSSARPPRTTRRRRPPRRRASPTSSSTATSASSATGRAW